MEAFAHNIAGFVQHYRAHAGVGRGQRRAHARQAKRAAYMLLVCEIIGH
jgi:hypothetical protein